MTKYKLHNTIHSLFKKINAKQHVVGWYGIGPNLGEKDLDIHGLFHDYVPNHASVIIDVQPQEARNSPPRLIMLLRKFKGYREREQEKFQRREGGTWIGDSADIVLNETMVGNWWQIDSRVFSRIDVVLLEQSSSLKVGKKSFMREMARIRRKLEHFWAQLLSIHSTAY